MEQTSLSQIPKIAVTCPGFSMESPPSSLPSSTEVTPSVVLGSEDPKSSRELFPAPPLFPEIPLFVWGFPPLHLLLCVLAGAFSAPAPLWFPSHRGIDSGENKHFCKGRSAINQNSDFYLARGWFTQL